MKNVLFEAIEKPARTMKLASKKRIELWLIVWNVGRN